MIGKLPVENCKFCRGVGGIRSTVTQSHSYTGKRGGEGGTFRRCEALFLPRSYRARWKGINRQSWILRSGAGKRLESLACSLRSGAIRAYGNTRSGYTASHARYWMDTAGCLALSTFSGLVRIGFCRGCFAELERGGAPAMASLAHRRWRPVRWTGLGAGECALADAELRQHGESARH